jgi:hypothetical protein
MTLDEYFDGNEESRRLFDCLRETVESLGPVEILVQQSQVAFRKDKAFAYAWMPGKYLRGRGAPLVLTIGFRRRDTSPRWKKVVEAAPGRFTHHMEIHSPDEIDDQVRQWLQEARKQVA